MAPTHVAGLSMNDLSPIPAIENQDKASRQRTEPDCHRTTGAFTAIA
jgi:hypothetical protein